MDTETLTFKDIGIMRPSGVICLHIFYRANTLVKTIFIIKNIYGQYNINTKHERDSETRFPYINPSPCKKEYWIRRVYIKQNKSISYNSKIQPYFVYNLQLTVTLDCGCFCTGHLSVYKYINIYKCNMQFSNAHSWMNKHYYEMAIVCII